tara:strand:- start:700 stop:933 length:234 start_codon:yes stop_codon:yes gene_type:complete
MNKFTGKLTGIKRLNNSTNGNPKFQLHFGNEVVTTSTDSMIAYMITDSLLGETLNLKYHYTPKKHKAILDNLTWNIS